MNKDIGIPEFQVELVTRVTKLSAIHRALCSVRPALLQAMTQARGALCSGTPTQWPN